jgi:hypothetical protein
MSFVDNFKNFKSRILNLDASSMNEETTKNAIIMPFFVMLGYDVFNPAEFVPEYTCDVATKKGEKVDYAILHDSEPLMLIEVKKAGMKLQKQQQGQLYRYFSTNRCRIAVLTNGFNYLFFSDINTPNIMDDDPFFSFNIIEDDANIYLTSLEQFCKDKFNIKTILSKAVYLKYEKVVTKTMLQDLQNPSDEIVKYFMSRPEIKSGSRITAQMIDKYRESTIKALQKVFGATIAPANITPAVKNDTPKLPDPEPEEIIIPDECVEILNYISANKPGYAAEYNEINGVYVIRITCDNKKIGRVRVSYTPAGKARFDYTDYKQNNKLLLLTDINSTKAAI